MEIIFIDWVHSQLESYTKDKSSGALHQTGMPCGLVQDTTAFKYFH